MTNFRALLIEKSADGKFGRRVTERSVDQLPAGDVLIDVLYSSLNYKDGLSATGNPGVSRTFRIRQASMLPVSFSTAAYSIFARVMK